MRNLREERDVNSPDVTLGDVPPEMQFQLVSLLDLDGLLQREEDGEPGEHAGGVSVRQDGDDDILVKLTLKIPSEAVEDRVSHQVERERFVSVVINHSSLVGMVEFEQRLRGSQLETVLNKTDELY